jgi:hypothetical protein
MTAVLTRRLYLTAWLMLGAIAVGYFYFLFYSTLGPRAGQASTGPVAEVENTGKRGSIKMASTKTGADPGVSQAISNMRMEMTRLKGSLEAMGKENTALKAYIKTLEAAFGPTTASLPKEPATPKPGGVTAVAPKRAARQPRIEVTMRPMPGDGFAVTDMQRAPLPVAGPSAPTRTLFAIQLAKKLKPGTTGARWTALKKRHARILGQLQPRTVEVPIRGTRKKSVTLIAGPFTNAAAAARACAKLIAAGTKCESTIYTGTPIGKIAKR